MKKMSMYNMNNEAAVSPIVATLVLIVVAVVGAVAVGTIMGTFSTQVGKQANANGAADASSTTLLVGGSTTMYPVINALAPWYASNHSGFQVNVQQGGSGAGISGTASGILDIGMFSEPVTTAYQAQYPLIHSYRVGKGGVIIISSADNTFGSAAKASDVGAAYNGGPAVAVGALAGNTKALTLNTRIDKSGTADTLANWAGITNIYDTTKATGQDGNGKMWNAIKGGAGQLGYTDFEYYYMASAADQALVTIMPIQVDATHVSTVLTAADWSKMNQVERGINSVAYPPGLTRDLNLLTEGPANGLEQSFISFVQQASMKSLFNADGMTHVSELS